MSDDIIENIDEAIERLQAAKAVYKHHSAEQYEIIVVENHLIAAGNCIRDAREDFEEIWYP